MVVSEDRMQALVGYYRVLQPVNTGYKRLVLKGLQEDSQYTVSSRETSHYGDELMNCGLVISDRASGVSKKETELGETKQGDYYSCLFLLEAI
jgi:alpha-galactosidase